MAIKKEFELISCIGYLPKLKLHYLRINSKDLKKIGGLQKNTRFICSVNNETPFHGGLVALGDGEAYITISISKLKKMGLKENDEVNLKLKKDDSKYGMEVPEALEALLNQDKEGFRRFEKLSPGKQRYIIYYVSSVKSEALRIERAVRLIHNLKMTQEGKEDFKTILGK